MALTLIQIETLYWIARLGGFSAAAKHMSATQPAISARIRQLEEQLGARLLDRDRKGIRLTAKGHALYAEAEALIQQIGRIRKEISDPTVVTGTIRLGVAELVAVTWLSALVSRLNEQYPRLRVELDVDLTLSLFNKLEAGELDIALLPGPISDSRLSSRSVGTVPFAWMASPALDLPKRLLSPVDLARWPIITLSNQSNLHRVLEEWFAHANAELRRVDICNSLTVVTEMVVSGIGVGYLSVPQTLALVERGRLSVLETTPPIPRLEYFAVHSRSATQPMASVVAGLAAANSTFDPVAPAASENVRAPVAAA